MPKRVVAHRVCVVSYLVGINSRRSAQEPEIILVTYKTYWNLAKTLKVSPQFMIEQKNLSVLETQSSHGPTMAFGTSVRGSSIGLSLDLLNNKPSLDFSTDYQVILRMAAFGKLRS